MLIGAEAQKIKYKDLFVFLNAGQYKEAEPLLRKYLKDTDDNPNAFMYMGYIYEEKFYAADVLKEPSKVALYGDSAAYFLELANRNMSDKEIKKNDDFYQKFSRRNPRTGEFGIELSDVTNELGEKTKEIRDRQQKVIKLNRYFYQAVGAYDRLVLTYKNLTQPYENIRQFYLRSNDSLVAALEDLTERQDSVTLAFNSAKSVLTQMGKNNYNQKLELVGIKDFKSEGQAGADFFAEKVLLWDYNYWAQEAIKTIKKEIKPLLSGLVLVDTDLTNLRNKVSADSVSVRAELDEIQKKLLSSNLLNYDPNPMPHAVLLTKVAEIRYSSEVVAGKADRRSQDLVLRKAALDREAFVLKELDSLSNGALNRNLEQELPDYRGFVRDTYGSLLVMQSFLRTTNDYAKNQYALVSNELFILKQAMNYIVDGYDSIPAMEGAASETFFPVFIQEEAFTTGVTYRNDTSKVNGYFYTITKDRKPQIKAEFPLSHASFHYSKRGLMGGTVLNSVMGLVYFSFIWSEEVHDGKVPLVVSKIYTGDGLSWSNLFWVDSVPDQIKMAAQTGEITLTVMAAEGPKNLTISKDGKLIP